MHNDTKSRLSRLIRRERFRYCIGLLACLLVFGGVGAFWLEPWKAGDTRIATVISYYGNESGTRRTMYGGTVRAIIRLSDGTEGPVEFPHPGDLKIGEKILVREEVSTIRGGRRFM